MDSICEQLGIVSFAIDNSINAMNNGRKERQEISQTLNNTNNYYLENQLAEFLKPENTYVYPILANKLVTLLFYDIVSPAAN